MADTLLARLLPKVTAPEPAATLAMECILSPEPEVAQKFVNAVAHEARTHEFTLGRLAAEVVDGASQPDLTFWDSTGRKRLLIENKFWAGMTDAQPVKYLDLLDSGAPSMLLFVVPRPRLPGIWDELAYRCSRGNIELADELNEPHFRRAQYGDRTLAVTSWRWVLETLDKIARSHDHKSLEADVAQLRGLTDRMSNQGAFLPLRKDEVTDVRMAQRMINYADLIEEIVATARGTSTKKMLPTHGWHKTGRYFRFVSTGPSAWLGIDRRAWRRDGRTPLWLRIYNVKDPNAFETEFKDGHLHNDFFVPIYLTTGVERDRVVKDAALQVEEVSRKLERLTKRNEDDAP